jgi:hypothetical protein
LLKDRQGNLADLFSCLFLSFGWKMTEEKTVSRSMLEFFCKSNADKVVSCAWENSQYCLKSCRYYQQKYETREQDHG